MALTYLTGDLRKTQAQAILLGVNLQGEVEVNSLETDLRDQYPVFFSEYRRWGRAKHFSVGDVWFFRDAQPWLIAAFIRETGNSVTRLRYVEQSLLKLHQMWTRESLRSLAVAPLCVAEEWGGVKTVLEAYLPSIPLPMVVYDAYDPTQSPLEPPFSS